MLKNLVIVENPFEPSSWETVRTENVVEYLTARFPVWPTTGHIYHNNVARSCDVTPTDEETLDKLLELEGDFFVVIYPAAEYVALVMAIIAIVGAILVAVFFRPDVPDGLGDLEPTKQVNNALTDRKNTARVRERIPDIFGTIRSTPDLITVPYRFYKDNTQFEHSYMCIGRGEFQVSDIREDKTLVSSIVGEQIKVFGPNTSPNYGSYQQDSAILPTGGEEYIETVKTCIRHSSVQDLPLKPTNIQFPHTVGGQGGFTYVGNTSSGVGYIHLDDTDPETFLDFFYVGGSIDITGATFETIHEPPAVYASLDGTYVITSLTSNLITFAVGAGEAWDWFQLNTNPFQYPTGTLTASGYKWQGPFLLDNPNLTQIAANFVAPRGLFKETGTTRTSVNVTIQLEVTPVDSSGNPTGAAQTYGVLLVGSTSRIVTPRAATLYASNSNPPNLSPTGRYKVRACRASATDLNFSGTVVDEVIWQDLYGFYPYTGQHFGDVTTIQAITRATAGSRGLTRKLNCLVTRKIPDRINGTSFTALTTTNASRVDNILTFVCQDAYIGNRALSDIDLDNIYNTVKAVEDYFGLSTACEFNYSFDNANVSFEETIASLASAVHCLGYRRGSQIKLTFEKATPDSVLLFNHRNKLPGSEKRTARFGVLNDNDGVEYSYVDPIDDQKVNYYITNGVGDDSSALSPKRIESVGIRSKFQAHFLAWRIWNKIKYQSVAAEFEATQEADLLLLNDRILNSDNTRTKTQDGEIVSQNVLELTLSQPVTLAGSDLIFLQHTDGLVESISISPRAATIQSQVNDCIDITTESSGTYTLVLAAGFYDVNTLATEIQTKLNSTTWPGFVTASVVNGRIRFTVTDPDEGFALLGATGISHARSALPTCGFNAADTDLIYQNDVLIAASIPNGTDTRTVILGQAPRITLGLGENAFARTTYAIVSSTSDRTTGPFLVNEKDSDNGFTFKLKVVNYDDRYYKSDYDYKAGIIDTAAAVRFPYHDFSTFNSGQWIYRFGTSANVAIVVDGSNRYLRMTNNPWIEWITNIPFNPNILYKLRIRYRQYTDPTVGGKLLYAGLCGVGQDGVTLVNIAGANTWGTQHYYPVGASQTPGQGFVEYIGYWKGTAAVGTNGSSDPSTPGKLHQNVRFIRPLIGANYSAGNGIQDIDYFELTGVPE